MATKNTNSIFIAGLPKWVKPREVGGKTVTEFSLNHEDKKGKKHYFNVTMWGLEEDKIDFLKNTKEPIVVKGTLKYDEYENKEGVKVRKVSIVGFDFDEKVMPAPPKGGGGSQAAKVPAKMMDEDNDPFDDDEEDPFA